MAAKSDASADSAERYQRIVREYLRTHDEVASKEGLRAGTSMPTWYIEQIASINTFYTSVNHNRVIALTVLVGTVFE